MNYETHTHDAQQREMAEDARQTDDGKHRYSQAKRIRLINKTLVRNALHKVAIKKYYAPLVGDIKVTPFEVRALGNIPAHAR